MRNTLRSSLSTVMLIATLISSTSASAKNLLNCSPPSGAGIMDVEIIQVGSGIGVIEVNAYGSISEIQALDPRSWQAKSLSWKSKTAGSVKLKLITIGGAQNWSWSSKGPVSAEGYCHVNPFARTN